MTEQQIALQKCVDHWKSQHTPECSLEQAAEAILSSLEMAYDAGVKAGEAKAAPPPGHIIDNGVVRKVLGTLPLTADGMVAGAGCELWADFNAVGMDAPLQCLGPGQPCVPMSRLYGSREAAEAARKEGKP